MDSGLRKRHKWMWLLLTPLVAVLMVLSVQGLDFFSSKAVEELDNTSSMQVQKEAENDFFKIQIIQEQTGNALNIVVKKPLKSPSAVGYVYNASGKVLLPGQLDGESKSYLFRFDKGALGFTDAKGILVMDSVKNEELFKIEF